MGLARSVYLGCHIVGCSNSAVEGFREEGFIILVDARRGWQGSREPKVDKFRVALNVKQNIVRLDVPMDEV